MIDIKYKYSNSRINCRVILFKASEENNFLSIHFTLTYVVAIKLHFKDFT